MMKKTILYLSLLILMLSLLAIPTKVVQAAEITAANLINLMNGLRTHHGLAALVEDPILDDVAASDAAYMLANHLGSDIGGRQATGDECRLWRRAERLCHRKLGYEFFHNRSNPDCLV